MRQLAGSLALAAALLLGLPPALRAAVVAESIGERMTRYHADPQAAREALPSLALASPRPSLGPAPKTLLVWPEFEFEAGVRIARIHPEQGTSLYGTGEVGGPLRRNGRVTTCWNTDAYSYDQDSPSLYQSHPWVLAVRADGSAYGVLADTPARVIVDLRHAIEFRAQGTPFPLIVIERDTPQQVLAALADLTGHMPMPPKWALGYHQCRYSYYPGSEVLQVADQFRRRRIPCDVVWMDIDYMDGYRCFTFDPRGFPDPRALTDSLHRTGFHSVTILDPGIKREPGYAVFDQGSREHAWVKTTAGDDYVGRVWPGPCVFPDFTRAASRTFWADHIDTFVTRSGVDGIWNDMNEPAVFDVQTKTMPEDNRHRADPELGGPGPHARYHNVYGMLMARASREGLQAARPGERPFVLTRAGYLGGQRYAACWTGDNRAEWSHLAASVPMALNLGLSGQPFCGPDIGGFAGAGDGRMFARWMGLGTLLPFARGHAEKGTVRKEPWAFGPAVEATCRRALETRYRLLPYLYTVFREASVTGVPVMRPAFFADLKDPALRREDQAFLLGSDLLVLPDLHEYPGPPPTLPKGMWRRIQIAARAEDGRPDPDLPHLYLRPGAILPVGPVQQRVDERSLDTLALFVNPDGQGHAEGTLYEDAGDGYGYTRGEYRITRLTAEVAAGVAHVKAEASEGAWKSPATRVYVVTVAGSGR